MSIREKEGFSGFFGWRFLCVNNSTHTIHDSKHEKSEIRSIIEAFFSLSTITFLFHFEQPSNKTKYQNNQSKDVLLIHHLQVVVVIVVSAFFGLNDPQKLIE